MPPRRILLERHPILVSVIFVTLLGRVYDPEQPIRKKSLSAGKMQMKEQGNFFQISSAKIVLQGKNGKTCSGTRLSECAEVLLEALLPIIKSARHFPYAFRTLGVTSCGAFT